MSKPDPTEAINPVQSSSEKRRSYWQAAYDSLFSEIALPQSNAPKDTLESAKVPEEVSKKGKVNESYLSYVWNLLCSPITLGAPSKISEAEKKVGGIEKTTISPLEPPSPIDMALVNLYIREMREILERAHEEVSQGIEKDLAQAFKKQLKGYNEGLESTLALTLRLGKEDKAIKGEIRKTREKVDELNVRTAFYVKINGYLRMAGAVFTVAGIAAGFFLTPPTGVAIAMSASRITLAVADGVTSLFKANLDRQLGAQKSEMIVLRSNHEIVQFRQKTHIERMENDDRCLLKTWEMMKTIADNAHQAGQFVLSK